MTRVQALALAWSLLKNEEIKAEGPNVRYKYHAAAAHIKAMMNETERERPDKQLLDEVNTMINDAFEEGE